MGLRIGQQREQIEVFAERAGPAVSQQQRHRVRAASGHMHQVHQLAIEASAQVGQLIQPGLEP